MAGRDTKARYQGVYKRHQGSCALSIALVEARDDWKLSDCDCDGTYFGVAWDKSTGRPRKTRHYPRASEARNARSDLVSSLRKGKPVGSSGMKLEAAIDKFVTAAGEGVVLNKHGRRYRDGAITDLRSSLAKVPTDLRRRRLDDLSHGVFQGMVDDFHAEGLSGSRIRSVVNSLRSTYRYSRDREFASTDPLVDIRLPAMDAEPFDRIIDPAEFARLVAVLDPADQVPFALAAYGSGRGGEVRKVDWEGDVTPDYGAVRFAGEGGKSAAARRVVPTVAPLAAVLRAAHLRQGRPRSGRVCPPLRESKSGEMATGQLLKRARKVWQSEGLEPVTLQDCRHACATWLDHAGVSPKIISVWVGHTTPERQPGAAPITLNRYTHQLPGELGRARDQFDAFLAERTAGLREVR